MLVFFFAKEFGCPTVADRVCLFDDFSSFSASRVGGQFLLIASVNLQVSFFFKGKKPSILVLRVVGA